MDEKENQMKTIPETSPTISNRLGIFLIAIGIFLFIIGLFTSFHQQYYYDYPFGYYPYITTQPYLLLGIILIIIAIALFIYGVYRIQKK